MARSTEVAFILEFTCRHCGTELVGRSVSQARWLRCPICGKGNRPPEARIDARPKFVHLPENPPDDLLVIGPPPELKPMTAVGVADLDDSSETAEEESDFVSTLSIRSVVASTILFLSLTMIVLSILQQSPYGGTIFGTTAVASTVLLLWPSNSSRRA